MTRDRPSARRRVLTGDYLRLFSADTVSTFGSAVSALALQFLLIDTLHANQSDIGLVRSARWAPYLVFGLLGGVIADRMRRKPLLVTSDLLSAGAFATIGGLALAGRLTIPALTALVVLAGAVTCVSTAAYQSYIPRLVPADLIPAAFAREAQMGATADAVGPLASGTLVRLLSAPVAILLDAMTYAVSAVLTLGIRTVEPPSVRTPGRRVLGELREGAAWVYGHRTLAPYAVSLHLWFVGYAVLGTVEVYFANRDLGLGEVSIGLILVVAGVTGLAGAGLAPRLASRFGVGPVCVAAGCSAPLGVAVMAVAPRGPWAVPVLVVAHAIFGLYAIPSSLSMTYRTIVTPDGLRARMNATIRTVNWGGLALASLAGGLLATTFGNRATLAGAAVVMALSTVLLALSPFRGAQLPGRPE